MTERKANTRNDKRGERNKAYPEKRKGQEREAHAGAAGDGRGGGSGGGTGWQEARRWHTSAGRRLSQVTKTVTKGTSLAAAVALLVLVGDKNRAAPSAT